MTDKSCNNWHFFSDAALLKQIGSFIKQHRLDQNKTQETLSKAAGISRSTLSLLERGETVNLDTLIRVLRVLDQLEVMDVFVVHQTISPLLLLKMEKQKRKRARRKNNV